MGIRYVCLSDMHLGAKTSVLTNLKTASPETDPLKASPVMAQLVECLKDLLGPGKKVTLILNGDILELALATDNEAYMAFERFVELVLKPGKEVFDRIIYLPGNHDHHLWELARETQYMNYVVDGLQLSDPLPVPWHTTNMFVEDDLHPVVPYTLNRLVSKLSKDFRMATAYPNFALLHKNREKCVIFHHGHYVESLYHFMTTLKNLIFSRGKDSRPLQIWELEAENFAWIDFFWSTMGRSGEAGKDVGIFYEKMQDPQALKQLLYNLADNLVAQANPPWWAAGTEKEALKWLIGIVIDRIGKAENLQTEEPLSDDAEKGLWSYVDGPLREQLVSECNRRQIKVPEDVTFVFGHTHKAFEDKMNFKEYPQWVKVYNSGGWVVESVDPKPLHGGAVILIDDDLDVVSLRMYNEDPSSENYRVRVEEAAHPGDPLGPFCTAVKGRITSSADLWKAFSDAVARAVHVREENLRAEINERV